MYMESKYWSWRNIIQLEALQVWWFIILIDSVREYEKTGLEGVSGSGLVPDCCHIALLPQFTVAEWTIIV